LLLGVSGSVYAGVGVLVCAQRDSTLHMKVATYDEQFTAFSWAVTKGEKQTAAASSHLPCVSQ